MKHIKTPVKAGVPTAEGRWGGTWNIYDRKGEDIALVAMISSPDERAGSPKRSARTAEVVVAINCHDLFIKTLKDAWTQMARNDVTNIAQLQQIEKALRKAGVRWPA